MIKKILTLSIVLLVVGGIATAGTLEEGLREIQRTRTYQEFYNTEGWTSSREKVNHITAKVFDMEKDYNSRISRLEAQVSNLKEENLIVRREVRLQEQRSEKRQEELRSLLSNIVLILMKK